MTFSTPSGARSARPSSGVSRVRISHCSSFGSRVMACPSRFALVGFIVVPTKKQCRVPPSTTSVGSITRRASFHGSSSAAARNGLGFDQFVRSDDSAKTSWVGLVG